MLFSELTFELGLRASSRQVPSLVARQIVDRATVRRELVRLFIQLGFVRKLRVVLSLADALRGTLTLGVFHRQSI